jgi:hypothetical protein
MEFHMLNRNVTSRRSLGLLPRRALGLVAVAAVLPLAACNLDEALQVENPYVVTPGVARDTVNLPTTYAGAAARFATALSGRYNREGGLIMQTATLTDEMISTDGFGTRNAIDRRAVGEGNAAAYDPYQYLQRARAEAVNAAVLFSETSQSGSVEHANLYNIIGFSELLMAEAFCSGVPLSLVDVNGEFQNGAQQSTEQLLDSAVVAFQQALTMAGSNAAYADEANLARIGIARARMFMGRYAEAAAMAAQVPSTFRYIIGYDAATQETANVVEQMGNGEKRWGVVDREGVNGLDFLSARDPRVPWGSAGGTLYGNDGNGADGGVTGPHYSQLKYPARGSDVLLASGMEARFIEAEAALKANNVAVFTTQLNAARAAGTIARDVVVTLPALTDAEIGATATERARTLFRERAFSLWLTAHRVGDLRRMQRHFGFAQDQIWPIGADMRGNQYGDDVSMDIPLEERNNPLFTGCLAPPSTP